MLHTVNKSPFDRNSLERCMRTCDKGSAILLIEDGVYGGIKGSVIEDKVKGAMKDVKIYALEADLDSRGIKGRVIDGIQLVDYNGFVDLTVEYDKVQSWL
ncbi:MAG: sulfurtransferase complex subunit TusB [Gammaproteobacteria bacterium]|nr:sulfurtransferase complex subunit TusB [Gammaproteobacteria bacterium]MDH5594817.1 sulfurtransferase complex subunit TusB [Gammaproteobacteria bacterium]